MIQEAFAALYQEKVDPHLPIRQLNLSVERIQPAGSQLYQNNLFIHPALDKQDKTIEKVMIAIKKKHGKNAILRGINYLPRANQRKRNTLIGGHHA